MGKNIQCDIYVQGHMIVNLGCLLQTLCCILGSFLPQNTLA